MPDDRSRTPKIREISAKEASALAWIQDAYGNVLLVQQSYGKQLWSLPGGKVRAVEGIREALRREVKEEIGLTVVSEEIIDLFDRPNKASLAVLFHVNLRKGKLKLAEGEIQDAAFVDKLPRQATPSARYFWKRHFPRIGPTKSGLDY